MGSCKREEDIKANCPFVASAHPSKSLDACVFQEFADSVSQLVTQKFRELTVGLTSVHARHKALAGIVMTKGNHLFPFLWELLATKKGILGFTDLPAYYQVEM